MPSFAYKSLILLYDNDDGTTSWRHQKLRLIPGTNQTYVTITPLIAAREVSSSISTVMESTNTNGRHLDLVIDNREFKLLIPYGSGNLAALKACIKEVLATSQVIAGRYVGESLSNGDTANNNF